MASQNIVKSFRLLKDKVYINGKWQAASKGKLFPITSPATKQKLLDVPDLCEFDVGLSILSAHKAFPAWSRSSCKYRAGLLHRLSDAMLSNEEELATIMTMECGKPITESRQEVKYAASFFEWFAEEAMRVDGDILPNVEPNIRRLVLRQPVGVSAMITPWNFPLAMITRKVGAALAAGCTAIVKPSEETPLSALAIGQLMNELDLPDGVVNFVTCSRETTPAAGNLLCTSGLVQKLSFTGSTKTGKWLLGRCADSVKRTSMELGGNAPCIVFDSADVELAAAKAIASRFRNSGQTCICVERIYVQEGVYEEFMKHFVAGVEQLTVGNPMHDTTNIGPLINESGIQKVEAHVEDAIKKGAHVLCGGARLEEGSLFYKPTVLTNCSRVMHCVEQETFGPVAPVIKFKSEEDVLRLANTRESGLAGYFFSNDYKQIWRVAEQLQVGMVGVNETGISSTMIPFGGVKESGIGREGSRYGIDEYTELKFVCLGNV